MLNGDLNGVHPAARLDVADSHRATCLTAPLTVLCRRNRGIPALRRASRSIADTPNTEAFHLRVNVNDGDVFDGVIE